MDMEWLTVNDCEIKLLYGFVKVGIHFYDTCNDATYQILVKLLIVHSRNVRTKWAALCL